jgi:hypothetical protein
MMLFRLASDAARSGLPVRGLGNTADIKTEDAWALASASVRKDAGRPPRPSRLLRAKTSRTTCPKEHSSPTEHRTEVQPNGELPHPPKPESPPRGGWLLQNAKSPQSACFYWPAGHLSTKKQTSWCFTPTSKPADDDLPARHGQAVSGMASSNRGSEWRVSGNFWLNH